MNDIVLERNPRLCNLVGRLRSEAFGTKTGAGVTISKDLDDSVQKVLTCIRQQKTQYLKNRLKLDMLETIALKKDDFVMQEKPQTLQEIQEWLTLSRCLDYFPTGDSHGTYEPDSRLLGLTREDISAKMVRIAEKWEDEQSVTRYLVPCMETRVKKIAESLLSFQAPDATSFDDLKFAQMVGSYGQRNAKLFRDRWSLESVHLQETLNSLYLAVCEALNENLGTICEVMCDAKFRFEFEKSLIFDSYHYQVMKNVSLKLTVLKFDLLLSLYDSKTVKDLKGIRTRFEGEMKELQTELQSLMDQLDAFQGLGPKFREIVVKYQNTLTSLISVHQDLERLE